MSRLSQFVDRCADVLTGWMYSPYRDMQPASLTSEDLLALYEQEHECLDCSMGEVNLSDPAEDWDKYLKSAVPPAIPTVQMSPLTSADVRRIAEEVFEAKIVELANEALAALNSNSTP